MVGQLLQIVGALLVLGAFALSQFGRLAPSTRTYLALNLVGAGILAVEAYLERQWGFLILEAAWALVAAWGLARTVRRGEVSI